MRRTWGLVLFECVVYLIVVGILSSLSFVAYRQWWLRSQAASVHRDLVTAINEAAALAADTGRYLQLCGSSDGVQCDDKWSKGWGIYRLADKQMQNYHRLKGVAKLRWSGSLHQALVFSPGGRPDGMEGGWRYSVGSHLFFHLVLLRTGGVFDG